MRQSWLKSFLHQCKSQLTALITDPKAWFRRYSAVLLSLVLIFNCISDSIPYGWDFFRWDWMLISGVVAFIIGMQWSKTIPSQLTASLTRLANRDVLLADTEQLAQFNTTLAIRADVWAHQVGIIAAAAIVVAFLVPFGFRKLVLMTLEGVGGYLGGRYLGRMASYGTLQRVMRREGLQIKVQPLHIDTAAGLKPLGDFYFLQAMVAAIPAVFLAVWWVIIPLLPQYTKWRQPYLGLLAIAIILELLAFAVPLWLFHLEMEEQKTQLLKDADVLSCNICEIQAQLTITQNPQEREQLKEQLSYLTKRYWDIEQMPTWPVDIKTLRRFTLNNMALVLPLVSQFTGQSVVWQSLEKLVNGLLQTK